MGGKRLLKKCVRRIDRISSLPDDVIVHILSFLPLKEAAASTCLVSKRWSHMWKYSPKITLRFRHNDTENINRANTALELLHKAPSLQEFTVDIRVERSQQEHVAKWLEYAFLRRVERLDLDLRGVGWVGDAIGCPCFDQEMLGGIVCISSSSSSSSSCAFKSLKVLCLRSFQVCGDAVGFFLRNCVSLERLVIYRASRKSDLEVVGPSLKHLDMRSRSLMNKSIDYDSNTYFREDYSIKVRAPNLTWLTIDQNSNVLFLEHVPKLANLNFYCRFQLGDTMHHFANVAARLVTLIIHLFDPKPEAEFWVPEMPKLRRLVVYLRSNCKAVPLPVTRFLCASPCLEEFKLDISELCLRVGRNPFRVGPPCPHRHLKLFVLSGFCGVTHCCGLNYGNLALSLDLVRYMVDNCVVLEEIVAGQCDRVGLVRDIVGDSYDPLELEDVIVQPGRRRRRHTPQVQEAFRNTMQLQQIPAHIKLRIVFEETDAVLISDNPSSVSI